MRNVAISILSSAGPSGKTRPTRSMVIDENSLTVVGTPVLAVVLTAQLSISTGANWSDTVLYCDWFCSGNLQLTGEGTLLIIIRDWSEAKSNWQSRNISFADHLILSEPLRLALG